MSNDNREEPTEYHAKGIVGKAYLDIDRVFNVSDYKKQATSKDRKNK